MNVRIVSTAALGIAVVGALGFFYSDGALASADRDIDTCLVAGTQKEQCLNGLVENAGKESVEAGFDMLAAVYARDQEFAAQETRPPPATGP